MTENGFRSSSRSRLVGVGVACCLIAVPLGGCGASGTVSSSTQTRSYTSPHARKPSSSATASATSPSKGSSQTTLGRTSSSTSTSGTPGPPAKLSHRTPARTSSTTSSASAKKPSAVKSPVTARASRTPNPATVSEYEKVLRRRSAAFTKARSQFSALADGAPPAEVGAAAPTFAAAAASFKRSLTRLNPPVMAAVQQSRLEAQLKQLSLELTKLADDSETGNLTGAKTELAAVTRSDRAIARLRATSGS